jgi:hypothetical protein
MSSKSYRQKQPTKKPRQMIIGRPCNNTAMKIPVLMNVAFTKIKGLSLVRSTA